MKKILKVGAIIPLIALCFIFFEKVDANYNELEIAGDGEKKARNVWCQQLGDRQGCRDDNT